MNTTRILLPATLLAAAFALAAKAETRVSLDLHLGPPAPIVVREAPPRRVLVETQYAAPGPGYVWVAGHQTWMNGGWVWIPGTWVRPPQPDAFYVEGRWDERSRNWVEAHWELRGPAMPGPGPEVIVEAPPPPRREHPGYRPGPEFVWIDGYWAWHGRRYEWVAGRWDRPPHGRGHWNAPRWEHRGGSYVFVEGGWR